MPTGILRRRAGVAVAVAAVLMSGLSACSDPAQPATLPTKRTTTAATTTAAPTTSTPEPPTPEEEVEQFIRDYFNEVTRAIRTQNASTLKALSTDGCPCFGYVKVVRNLRRADQRIPNLDIQILEQEVREVTATDALISVRHRLSAYDVLDSQGNLVKAYEPHELNWDFSLVKSQADQWIIGNSIDLEGE